MDLSSVTQYLNRIDLLTETANQIIKDFEMFGMQIHFSGNRFNAYEELFNQIEPHISKLISDNQQKFMAILYRIDLSNEQIQKAVKQNASETFSEIITDLIIKRELQKVVIRAHYRNK